MRSQHVSIIATQRSSAVPILIIIFTIFVTSCASSQPSQSATSLSPSPAQTKSDDPRPKFFHDIPPQIVIDVGSFSIETDQVLENASATTAAPVTVNMPVTASAPIILNKGIYRRQGENVCVALIKIIRKDDGAILYQNFNANGATVEFTVNQGDKKITITPKGGEGNNQTLEFDSSEVGNLQGVGITELNNRHYRFEPQTVNNTVNNTVNFDIKTVTIKKGVKTLFSHDTPSSQPHTPTASPLPQEYSDKKYRIFILVEVTPNKCD